MENLQLNRTSLFYFARNMGNPAYPNDEALLKFLFRTPSAVATFVELMHWFRYSKRADGAIYKSDADLARAIGRSPKSIERTRTILKEAGFTIFIQKANGAPTNHYRFDPERFLAFIADRLKVEIEKVRQWFTRQKADPARMSKSDSLALQNDDIHSDAMSKSVPTNVQMDSTPNVEIHSDNLPASLTSQKPTEKNDIKENRGYTTTTPHFSNQVVDSFSLKMEIQSLARLLRIEETVISGWVRRYGLERVKEVATRAVTNEKVSNPGGFAIRAIENNWQWATNDLTPDDDDEGELLPY